jgi:hypothetical protein
MSLKLFQSNKQFSLSSDNVINVDNSISIFVSGVLMGITNMAATIPGFAVPALVGALTHANVSI